MNSIFGRQNQNGFVQPNQPSTMRVTPAAVEEYFNVSANVDIPIWKGCCQTVTVRNTSDQLILMQNANIRITRPDLYLSR